MTILCAFNGYNGIKEINDYCELNFEHKYKPNSYYDVYSLEITFSLKTSCECLAFKNYVDFLNDFLNQDFIIDLNIDSEYFQAIKEYSEDYEDSEDFYDNYGFEEYNIDLALFIVVSDFAKLKKFLDSTNVEYHYYFTLIHQISWHSSNNPARYDLLII